MNFNSETPEDERIKAEIEVMVCLNSTRDDMVLYSIYSVQKKELAWLMETEIPRLAAIFDDLMKVSNLYIDKHIHSALSVF